MRTNCGLFDLQGTIVLKQESMKMSKIKEHQNEFMDINKKCEKLNS